MAVWSEVALSELELNRIDAEFYKPDYLSAKSIGGEKRLKHYGVIVLHPAEFTRRYSDDGLPILLAQNNRDNSFDWSVKRFASREVRDLISRNRLEFGDVTITRSGANYGQTSVVGIELEDNEIFACADLLLLRTSAIDGHLLSTYFNSSVGKKLLDRGAYGAAQPHIAPNYIKEIPFPDFLVGHGEEIKDLVIQSRKCSKESETLYTQAQHLLESELGLDKLSFQKPVGYTARFSELEQSRRLDAEYFDPVASSIVERISTFDHVRLGANCNVGNGFPWNSKKFLEDNSGEPVVRIRNIRPSHIDIEELSSIDPKYARNIGFPKAKEGDVVVGMDGIKYFYASLLEGACYVNQRVAHLTWHPGAKISPEYATFIINSRVGQAQLLRDMTVATTVGHITNRNIFNLLIPYVSDVFHRQIANLIRESIDKKQESKELLHQAKTRVEQLIEEAVGS